ncbi:hypothetical protein pb186bvf_020473 [Paramecium bursaria]
MVLALSQQYWKIQKTQYRYLNDKAKGMFLIKSYKYFVYVHYNRMNNFYLSILVEQLE